MSKFSTVAKWTAGSAVVVLFIGSLILMAKPATAPAGALEAAPPAAVPPPPAAAGRLAATHPSFDFGTISMAQGKVTHRFPIRNSGTETLSIQKLYTSCMCTTAALLANGGATPAFGMPGHTPIPAIDVPIRPLDHGYVEIVFDPAAHGPAGVGPIRRVITVENSAGRPLELAFAAVVTP